MSILNLDSQLYEQASVTAAAQGLSVEQFVDIVLRQAVEQTSGPTAVQLVFRNGLPVVNVGEGVPVVDLEAVRHSLEVEGY